MEQIVITTVVVLRMLSVWVFSSFFFFFWLVMEVGNCISCKMRQLILSPCEEGMMIIPTVACCVFREVLSLEFLYLRVVSGCADGKIRIFNYLTGSCLKVLVASSRGEPVSFCVAGNRLVTKLAISLSTELGRLCCNLRN